MIGSARLSPHARALIEDKSKRHSRQRRLFYELDNKMRLKKLDLEPQELRAAIGLQRLPDTGRQ